MSISNAQLYPFAPILDRKRAPAIDPGAATAPASVTGSLETVLQGAVFLATASLPLTLAAAGLLFGS